MKSESLLPTSHLQSVVYANWTQRRKILLINNLRRWRTRRELLAYGEVNTLTATPWLWWSLSGQNCSLELIIAAVGLVSLSSTPDQVVLPPSLPPSQPNMLYTISDHPYSRQLLVTPLSCEGVKIPTSHWSLGMLISDFSAQIQNGKYCGFLSSFVKSLLTFLRKSIAVSDIVV